MTKQMTPLRRRMTDDMTIRNMSLEKLRQWPNDRDFRNWHEASDRAVQYHGRDWGADRTLRGHGESVVRDPQQKLHPLMKGR